MADPFRRLLETQTISTFARRIATKIPNSFSSPDSLDLALASTYDHHAVWGAGRANVVKQHSHCVTNHAGEYTNVPTELVYRPIVVNKKETTTKLNSSKSAYRDANNHVQLGIPPHHISNSRRGYGRGPDGCFYST